MIDFSIFYNKNNFYLISVYQSIIWILYNNPINTSNNKLLRVDYYQTIKAESTSMTGYNN